MIRIAIMLAAIFWTLQVQAAVSLSGTRLIFDGRFSEASLQVINRNEHEVLIQAWLSEPGNAEGDPQTSGTDLPFVLTPHLARLEPWGKQVVRLIYQGQGMSQTVESLLHLYVLEIPRRSEGGNRMSIAIRQRINVFYRPAALIEDPVATPQNLRWSLASQSLQVSNPTPFHVALQNVRLDGAAINDDLLLTPGASHKMPVPASPGPRRLSFEALTDYGSPRKYCAQASTGSFDITEHRQKDC